ncbi:MAG: 1-acyl-sn-glycerol-3-phosphate acyltransferase [Nitrospirae bacterium]|nr:1-acyl-sn-glycerol-3-phosphate acyltransferase [Nitrospirota bacterium]
MSLKEKIIGLVYYLSTLLVRFVFCINGGLQVKGRENVPPDGGVIIASNHLSYLDPPILGTAMPRRATFMARKGLFNIPFIRSYIRLYAFPVDRTRTLPSTIKEAVRRLKNGEALVMFPEGRRSETGALLEGKRGIGMVAGLSKVPIVPTLITGTDKALPIDARWLKRAKISVVFGSPIVFSAEDHGENFSKKIMHEIGELKRNADNGS